MSLSWKVGGEMLCRGWIVLSVIAILGSPVRGALPFANHVDDRTTNTISQGQVWFEFDARTMQALGVRFVARSELAEGDEDAWALRAAFPIHASSTFEVESDNGVFERLVGGYLDTCGALLLDRPGNRVVVGNLTVTTSSRGLLQITSTLTDDTDPYPTFDVASYLIDFSPEGGRFQLIGELTVNADWAIAAGARELARYQVGRIVIEGGTEDAVLSEAVQPTCGSNPARDDGAGRVAVAGSDVIIGDLQSVLRYGAIDDVTSFSIGTNACNIGKERANWIAYTNQHPVIIQNLYRIHEGRFEQIGMSWVKHGFFAVSQSLCTPCNDPTDGSQLGVGCSDPYSAYLNGIQTNMSPRSTVNAHTGYFPYPWNGSEPSDLRERRLLVRTEDIDPTAHPGATFFIEGHYVVPDDAAAGTNDNNASYRRVFSIRSDPGIVNLFVSSTDRTQRQQPGIRAWQDSDPDVVETDVRVPGEGLFILAAKAVEVESGLWSYSYALQNLNSDRSARSFRIPIPAGLEVTDIAFHDVQYHSGEPYVGTDWDGAIVDDSITWSTATYEEDPNANALRYDTVYSFFFTTPREPAATLVTVGLFKPGAPGQVTAQTIGPALDIVDCNANGVADPCDVRCDAGDCPAPCGQSDDCNANDVPDECEPDCDDDGFPDECEIAECPPGDPTCDDCNGNEVPDGCEADCNGDGYPDDCVEPEDRDADGVNDCFDLCPQSTTAHVCECPALGRCCWFGVCIDGYPRYDCVSTGGQPDCVQAYCRQGCLLGDQDGDGDIDLADLCHLQRCFSGPAEADGYVTPPQQCSIPFDFDDDDDVDLDDFELMQLLFSGP